MNISIEQIIAYEEEKKRQQQAEESVQREYAQVSYEEIKPEIEREKTTEEESACKVIITTL